MIDFHSCIRVHWQRVAFLGICVAFLSGCGDSAPYELATVSGVVTLDGNPVPYTQVSFTPKGTPEEPNPGPPSAATCDDTGKFELKTVRGDAGAVVGQHTVRISSTGPPAATNSDLPQPARKEAFPARYNESSELTFDVPADGTDAANFELTLAP